MLVARVHFMADIGIATKRLLPNIGLQPTPAGEMLSRRG
jgi:hypothetical protein